MTAAKDLYALKAYELELIDFLLNPFYFEIFYKSVIRLIQSKTTYSTQKSRNYNQ